MLNALARRDVAIVSPVAGTTRDAIEIRLDLDGIPVLLVDTAGLRESADAIEVEGVRRALQRVVDADLTLHLRAIDSDPVSLPAGASSLAIATKIDLPGQKLPDEVGVCARSGEGLDALVTLIGQRLREMASPEPALLTRERQRIAVGEAAAAISRAEAVDHGHPELIAEELRLAARALERLVGRIDVEDVLDSLFSGFCIGK